MTDQKRESKTSLTRRTLSSLPATWGLCCLWLGLVGGGMAVLVSYSNRAGIAFTVPQQIKSAGSGSHGAAQLLMFVHPRCPCSMASMRELARVMARAEKGTQANIYMYCPELAEDNWAQGSLWQAAAQIPGVRIHLDRGGSKAAEFGSTTSGHVLVYGPDGDLKYQGGITLARGHEGDNLGKSAVQKIVRGEREDVGHCPVFGCAIRSTATLPAK